MQIIIHAGAPKTGSTALQSQLYSNREWFRRRGFVIPLAGFHPDYGHATLFSPHLAIENAVAGDRDQQRAAGDLDALAEELSELRDRGTSTALLSWEGMILLPQADVALLAQALEGCEVRLLVYLREQVQLIESRILQFIKMFPMFRSLEDYYCDPGELLGIGLDYHEKLTLWREVFGARLNIETRLYERERFPEGDVVMDFLDWLSCAQEGFLRVSGSENESLDHRDALLLSLLRNAGLAKGAERRLVRRLLHRKAAPGSRQFLPDTQVELIRRHFRPGNERLARDFPAGNWQPDAGGALFSESERQTVADPVVDYLRELAQEEDPAGAPIWNGQALHGADLQPLLFGQLGWRQPEAGGVWSVGESSQLQFTPPPANPADGAVLRLRIRGQYIGENRMTEVCHGGMVRHLDLRDAEIELPLSGANPPASVRLELRHQVPVSPAELGLGDSRQLLAFKLESAAFQLDWSAPGTAG